MRSKNTITIVVGVVLALLGAGVAVAAGRSDGKGTGATKLVVVATRDISAGSAVSTGSVAVRAVAASAVPANAVTTLGALAGQAALVDISANQVITNRMFGVQGVAAPGGVSLPKGKKAIGVELGFAPGALRYVVPGDRIDVLASQKVAGGARTTVLLTGLQVIATTPGAGNGAATAAQGGPGTLDFLLAVDQKQAVTLVNAQAAGQSLYFTLARKGAA